MRLGTTVKPWPQVGQPWRFDRNGEIGVVKRILPGGAGDLGIVEFDGLVPSAHVSTMLQFDAWQPAKEMPVAHAPPCSCVTLEGGVVIADGCLAHDAKKSRPADVTLPALEERA